MRGQGDRIGGLVAHERACDRRRSCKVSLEPVANPALLGDAIVGEKGDEGGAGLGNAQIARRARQQPLVGLDDANVEPVGAELTPNIARARVNNHDSRFGILAPMECTASHSVARGPCDRITTTSAGASSFCGDMPAHPTPGRLDRRWRLRTQAAGSGTASAQPLRCPDSRATRAS